MQLTKTIRVLYCYAPQDKKLRDDLAKHLSMLEREFQLTSWHTQDILAGQNWDQQVQAHLNIANIILLLISSDFLASNECYNNMIRALERLKAGDARVIPILLRPADWASTPLSQLSVLPTDRKPITLWSNRDAAFLDVAYEIRKQITLLFQQQDMQTRLSAPRTHTVNSRVSSPTSFLQQQIGSLATQQEQKRTVSIPRYPKSIFVVLCIVYSIAWIVAFFSLSITNPSVGTSQVHLSTTLFNLFVVLYNVSIFMFIIVIATVLVIDWRRATTLCGVINWKTSKGKGRFWLACIYIFGFMMVLVPYFAMTANAYYQLSKQTKRDQQNLTSGNAPSQTQNPNTP